MGNVNSQIGNVSNKYSIETQSQHSLPKNIPKILNQQWVLPNINFNQKLKHTENGEILQSGGTLTGKHKSKLTKGSYMNVRNKVNYLKTLNCNTNSQNNQIKKFDSEPDLRNYLPQDRFIKRNKKYKAPLRPINKESGKSPMMNVNNELDTLTIRKTGLFRTHMETRKIVRNVVATPRQTKEDENGDTENLISDKRLLAPNLQKLSSSKLLHESFKRNKQEAKIDICNKSVAHNQNHEYENYDRKIKPKIVKKFYFGMTNTEDTEYMDYSIENPTETKLSNIIYGALLSDCNSEKSQEISLRLKPVLPKKTLEMPKFSPVAAWKMLVSYNPGSNTSECSNSQDDKDSILVEDLIEVVSSSCPTFHKFFDPILSQDKSGDSGISGDETPKMITHNYRNEISWTPQQDLGEDSSIEDEILSNSIPCTINNRPHIFSLSLPRDNLATHLAGKESKDYFYEQLNRNSQDLSGQKILKSSDVQMPYVWNMNNGHGSNWFLSKSAPNSLNNGFGSLEIFNKQEDTPLSLMPFHTQQNKGRIMYLPNDKDILIKPDENIHNDVLGEKSNLNPLAQDSKAIKTKVKNFTFQNTVRQIERKRMAEKLSKEVEEREHQRLKEIEAMQRIEEEFQKKRTR